MYSLYKRQRIIFYHNQGYKAPTIERLLRAEGLAASRRGISKFIAKYRETGSVGRRTGSGRPSKITAEVKECSLPPGPSIHQKFTFGQALVRKAQLKFAFSKGK